MDEVESLRTLVHLELYDNRIKAIPCLDELVNLQGIYSYTIIKWNFIPNNSIGLELQ